MVWLTVRGSYTFLCSVVFCCCFAANRHFLRGCAHAEALTACIELWCLDLASHWRYEGNIVSKRITRAMCVLFVLFVLLKQAADGSGNGALHAGLGLPAGSHTHQYRSKARNVTRCWGKPAA